MIYDVIIIGAGASGLFAGSSLKSPVNGLIIEKNNSPGKKILMAGAGQCNITHGGSIKNFLSHYGNNGKFIRSILYQFNNKSVMEFFSHRKVPIFEREDGKIFPSSLKSNDILNTLIESCKNNGLKFIYSSPVSDIYLNSKEKIYKVTCNSKTYLTKKVIVATGGCSYPSSGSDGNFFKVLSNMNINSTEMKPALVPIYVKSYPYSSLSGISFLNATITVFKNNCSSKKGKELLMKHAENKDDLLLTHNCFSGPAILNISRYADNEDIISINYFPGKLPEIILNELKQSIIGSSKQTITLLYDYFNRNELNLSALIPKRFLETICSRIQLKPSKKVSQLSGSELNSLVNLITKDTYTIRNLGDYNTAMVTSGGVYLDEINLKTLESKKYPNLFIIGEALDIDGDTGGYNLQFAFSSGYLAGRQI
ncbi:BaiN/RdsA family NAD(P)/FAD-dependent oxidoreductase [Anaerovorax odorimutans]|uniref:NAD(P)/FAD-dependent oxidoreductase n=1 Tax=Anaerovorax odorimutans TaxID=109327 RepID=UPI000423F3D0|nr:aminoacetone oxidase family FAD-binding enzyme [Anaerovorax odorimutans]